MQLVTSNSHQRCQRGVVLQGFCKCCGTTGADGVAMQTRRKREEWFNLLRQNKSILPLLLTTASSMSCSKSAPLQVQLHRQRQLNFYITSMQTKEDATFKARQLRMPLQLTPRSLMWCCASVRLQVRSSHCRQESCRLV